MRESSNIRNRVEKVLAEARTLAVLGAHVREHKPAFYVPDYMYGQGYRVLPVNPTFVGQQAWGEPFRPRLAEVAETIDLVNVFRRSAVVADHVEDILEIDPLPRWVWLQLGVRSDEAAERLRREGIEVIQDRCLLADHQRWGRPSA